MKKENIVELNDEELIEYSKEELESENARLKKELMGVKDICDIHTINDVEDAISLISGYLKNLANHLHYLKLYL